MSDFEAVFGFKSKEIKQNCILMPFIPKGILNHSGIDALKKGYLYACGNAEHFTLIHTGMGAPLAGDAVLYLKDTPCRNIILFGGCGAVNSKDELSIGNLVSPEKCFGYESFSDLLLEASPSGKIHYPEKKFFERFLNRKKAGKIQVVTCATLASLKLEEQKQKWLSQQGVHVVDMECSAFFSAAAFCHRSAAALFFITDILQSKPFYIKRNPDEKKILDVSIEKAFQLLQEFFLV